MAERKSPRRNPDEWHLMGFWLEIDEYVKFKQICAAMRKPYSRTLAKLVKTFNIMKGDMIDANKK